MVNRIVITDAAWSDMFEIGRRIQTENPARADSFVTELYERCVALAAFPRSHPLIADSKARGIRRIVHGDYLIFFRIIAAKVEVLHVLHGARDYERLLFPDEQR